MTELVSGVAEKVVELLASSAYKKITQACGVRDDLENLRLTVASVQAVLLDAEEKQLHSRAITLWLQQLKDTLYDAEDVLADFQAELLRRQVLDLKPCSFLREVSGFFSTSNFILFQFKMAHKVRDIWRKFDKIAKRKNDLGLVERAENQLLNSREREMTHSFVRPVDIIGREKAKESVISYLAEHAESPNISIIPIVGLGGLGKTALAKVVYNDNWVTANFDIKIWVCVSTNFDLKQIIPKIIKSATGGELSNVDIEELQKALRNILVGNKYLLVLDDVWEEDQRKWWDLKALLMEGANGCKVIVTTWSPKVVSIVGTVAPYEIEPLPHEDCLKLFFKCTFGEGQHQQYPNLEEIGQEIVRKCKGVPLAVMTLGNLLRYKTDECEWKSVRDSEIWRLEQKENDILPALKLSYERLPSHLKRCFAYCSIFPKDYELFDMFLIRFWMALNLLQPSHGGQDLEDVGRSYFYELLSRGFFQDVQEIQFFATCTMHDLVHDLASAVLGDELFNLALDNNYKEFSNPQRIRYLSALDPVPEPIPRDLLAFLNNLEHIRAVCIESVGESLGRTFTSKFRYLRMLILQRSYFDILPQWFGDFQHLKYLDLSDNMKIRELPSSICRLHNLQTLILEGCSNLEKLPKNLKYLVSLRFLAVTIKQVCLPNDGIGSLRSLRLLMIVGCENLEHLCEDIHGLKNLRTLCILGCVSLRCLPQGVKYLPKLETLFIEDCEDIDLRLEDGESNQKITSCSVKNVTLAELPKLEDFPQWLLKGSANTLQRLSIEECENLKQLPDVLQSLSMLQHLEVNDCPNALDIERCRRETGEDWHKISRIPNIEIDGINI